MKVKIEMKNKTVYEAELDINAPVINFRKIVEEVAGVPLEGQKIKFKKRIITLAQIYIFSIFVLELIF